MSRAEWRISSDCSQPVRSFCGKPARRKPSRQTCRGASDSVNPSNPSALNARRVSRVLPVLSGAAEDHAAGNIGMVAREQLGDRPAHRVADHQRRRESRVRSTAARIGGAVAEAERHQRPQPAAMPAVVDREHPVARFDQVAVGAAPVEVARRPSTRAAASRAGRRRRCRAGTTRRAPGRAGSARVASRTEARGFHGSGGRRPSHRLIVDKYPRRRSYHTARWRS